MRVSCQRPLSRCRTVQLVRREQTNARVACAGLYVAKGKIVQRRNGFDSGLNLHVWLRGYVEDFPRGGFLVPEDNFFDEKNVCENESNYAGW